MKSFTRLLAYLVLAASMAACGGGGGSGANSTTANQVTPGGSWLTFTPSAVDLSVNEGDQMLFTVNAKASQTFSRNFSIGIIDKIGVISNVMSVNALNPYEYVANLRTAANLAPGEHTTTLEVRLCEDDPLVCKTPLPGSPWYIPVKVTVKAKVAAVGALSLTPATVNLSAVQGDIVPFTVNAKLTADFGKLFNVGVFDTAGVISSNVQISTVSSKEYNLVLQTSSVLTPGVHTTTLQVRLCEDDTKLCTKPLAGSPWLVPLTVTVAPNTNLTPLQTLPQLGAWSTYQGNAAHTGYVAASFNVSKFSRRWNLSGGTSSTSLYSLAIDNGTVFSTTKNSTDGHSALVAVSEDSGKVVWRADMGILNRVNSPAAANGKVYVTSTGHADTYFWVFNQQTGSLISKTSMNSQWENYLAPTVVGDDVYTESGYYGGMSKFNISSNKLVWGVGLPQFDSWTPAVDSSYAYAYLSGNLYAISVLDGKVAFQLPDADYLWNGYTGLPVVLSGKQMAYVANGGRLMGFDLAGRRRAWSLNGSVLAQPAYAKGSLYVLNASGSVLEARSEKTGALLWTSNTLQGLKNETTFNHVIVTDNLAFVSSGQSTLAIDLTTHTTVWKYPLGGDLSISDRGVLYILDATGNIAAINLQ